MIGNKPLGDFLRSRRTRLDPATLNLASSRRRRTPGLKREEVAERAGISCEWYIKLEQGREVRPSQATVAALIQALALDEADAAHLRRLTQCSLNLPFERERVSAIVSAIVEGLPEPAYVTGARWDVLTWNPAADVIFNFGAMDEANRNILLFMFGEPKARRLFGQSWSSEARRMLALFRVAHDQHAADPAFSSLVTRLQAASVDFRRWWSSHDVKEPSAGLKTLHLPGGTTVTFAYASFQSHDTQALKLSLYKRLP